jgi:MFS family permease
VFQTAFWFRHEGTATIWFGLVLAASAVGMFAGNAIAAPLRQTLREERMIVLSLGLLAVTGFIVSFMPSPFTAAVLALVVGIAAATARAAFDAIVQRDAPDANQGRAFAQFETRFQLAWVGAGAIPVLIPLPGAVGFFIIGLIGAAGAVSYLLSTKRVRAGLAPPPPMTSRLWGRVRRARTASRHPAGAPVSKGRSPLARDRATLPPPSGAPQGGGGSLPAPRGRPLGPPRPPLFDQDADIPG